MSLYNNAARCTLSSLDPSSARDNARIPVESVLPVSLRSSLPRSIEIFVEDTFWMLHGVFGAKNPDEVSSIVTTSRKETKHRFYTYSSFNYESPVAEKSALHGPVVFPPGNLSQSGH